MSNQQETNMHTLTPVDMQFVVRRIPADVRRLLESGPFFVAGGFIRETIAGNEVRDIDVFGPTKGRLLDAAESFAAARKVKTHVTDNAITVLAPPRMPVQFITRWTFDAAQPLIESFDFTVCQAVIWFDQSVRQYQSMVADAFYPDLAARRLTYTMPKREEEAGGSMMRVRKFLSRGWNIQAQSLGAVIARVAGGVRNFDGLDETMRSKVIAGLLFEVDPLLVVDGLDPISEHEAPTA